MHNKINELHLYDNSVFLPGTKIKVKNDKHDYVILGYSSDSNKFICVKHYNYFLDQNTISFTKEDIEKILYTPK